jgi:lysophospholipase L1-like esterase
MKSIQFIVFAILFSPLINFAQNNSFENEILAFEKHDSLYAPKANANLFVGSSSIKFWKYMEADFEGYPVINRGFGGSNLLDLEYYLDRIVLKYKPAKIFIYSGENDISQGANEVAVYDRFRSVFEKIRATLPDVPIVFISIKPSIARIEQLTTQRVANKLIKEYIAGKPNTQFVNIVKKMMLKGKPNPSIFVEDKLHMNMKGYEIWTKALKKYLVK